MRARRRLRVVLDGKNRVLPVPDAFARPVVEVKVGYLTRLRARNAARFSPNGESVVLRRDKYLSRREIAHRVIAAAMSVWQLHRFPPHREAEQLMAETNPENRDRPVGQLPDCIDRVTDRRWVAGTVGGEQAVRFGGAHRRAGRASRAQP